MENRRFDVDEALRESDRFYNYYVNILKWLEKDKSFASKYKFLLFVIGDSGGTAFGGCMDNKIGTFWTPATRINRGPTELLPMNWVTPSKPFCVRTVRRLSPAGAWAR